MDEKIQLVELQRQINGKEDFAFFVENLVKNLRENPSDWENDNLERYLDAMAAWVHDMDGYYKNSGAPIPTNIDWQFLGGLLLASRIYE